MTPVNLALLASCHTKVCAMCAHDFSDPFRNNPVIGILLCRVTPIPVITTLYSARAEFTPVTLARSYEVVPVTLALPQMRLLAPCVVAHLPRKSYIHVTLWFIVMTTSPGLRWFTSCYSTAIRSGSANCLHPLLPSIKLPLQLVRICGEAQIERIHASSPLKVKVWLVNQLHCHAYLRMLYAIHLWRPLHEHSDRKYSGSSS